MGQLIPDRFFWARGGEDEATEGKPGDGKD
jgi:hypothetical protein